MRRALLAHQQLLAGVRGQVVRFVEASWRALPDYRDEAIARFVGQVVPVVLGGQQRIAQLTVANLQVLERLLAGEGRRQVFDTRQITVEALRGVPADEVYRRAGVSVWSALADDADLSTAIDRGRRRAVSIATTDLQLAQTHSAQQVIESSDRIVGYRRVLTGAEDCALCAIASTQRYRKAELMPVHPGCDCTVAPIIGDTDPGQVINAELLERTHADIAARFGEFEAGAREIPNTQVLYRDVMVRRHGEIGPVLTIRGHEFTGPDDI